MVAKRNEKGFETTGELLRDVARLHVRAQREQVSCCGTTLAQCHILTELGRSGPLPLTGLGRRLGLHKGWMSRAVATLVAEGLLERGGLARDERVVMLSLTRSGERRVDALNRTLNRHAGSVLARIAPGERERVHRALALVRDALREELQHARRPRRIEACRRRVMTVNEAFKFRLASKPDEQGFRSLLVSASLPVDDVSTDAHEYLLAHSGARLVGCVGLEVHGDAGLFRSFAVVPELRGQGLGAALFDRMVARSLVRGVKTGYVLTTTAERFCVAHGFERISRADVPSGIAATQQFRALCPATAACFRRRLDATAVHLPREVLSLRPDVSGATMWAVALDRAMLTYFELEPHARFDRHCHESEQITMVLEGELFFEVDGAAEIASRAREVIALPANVPHAARTRERPARAVDAWSPPRPDLIR